MNRIRVLAVAAATALLLAACGSAASKGSSDSVQPSEAASASAAEAVESGTPKKQFVVAWSPISTPTDNGRQQIDDSYKKAVEAAGGELEYCAPSAAGQATGDPSLQANCMDAFISKGVDAIVVWPVDVKAIVPSIKKANEANIPVFLHYTTLEGGNGVQVALSLANPNKGSIDQLAPKLVDFLTGKNGSPKGKVLIVQGSPTATDGIERTDFMVNALKDYPDIEVTVKPADWDSTKGTTVIQDWITANPDTDAIYLNSDQAYGISVEAALTAVGRWVTSKDPKHIWIGGIDSMDVGLNNVACEYQDVSSSQGYGVAVPAMGAAVMEYLQKGAEAIAPGTQIPVASPYKTAEIANVEGKNGPVLSVTPVLVDKSNVADPGLDGNLVPPPNGVSPKCD